MEPTHQTAPPPAHQDQQAKPAQNKRSVLSLMRKYWWQIIVFFIIAITSGGLLADNEAKSTANWEMFTSKDAGVTFKYPTGVKVVEDKGWRITVYTEQKPENNIKILYSHKNPNEEFSVEEQFLANCQAARVTEINTNGGRIKVYEDNTCGAQTVPNSVIIYSDNNMNYDVGIFGEIERTQLFKFLSTFEFANTAAAEPDEPTLPISPSVEPSVSVPMPAPISTAPEEMTVCTKDAMICPDGTTVGRTGPKCEFVCPQ